MPRKSATPLPKPAPAHAPAGFSLPGRKGKGKVGGAALLAHGAGGHKDHPHMLALAEVLASAGLDPIRFNFPYREAGRSFPDRMPVLVDRYRAEARQSGGKNPILAGHSMGTRAAVALAAEGFPCRGLVLFSYPLHPPGHPEKLRLDHLAELRVPVLSISGSKDAFCTPRLMGKAVGKLRGWTHHWIEGADHGLAVAKASGRTRGEALEEAADAIRAWLERNAEAG